MKSNIFRMLVFVGFFAIGYTTIIQTSHHFTGAARDPAAVRQNYDISHLRGSALDAAIKARLVSGFEIRKGEGQFDLSLGHFAFTDNEGHKTLGCRHYEKVHYQFAADGLTVNGEPPRMEVEGVCESSEDLARINPLTVPFGEIIKERPADGEFRFREGREVVVRFSHLGDEWPRKWLLRSIRLSGKSSALAVEESELTQLLSQSRLVTF